MITNYSSTLTRPANTTAYAQNDLIASNTSSGSIVVPSIDLPGTGGLLRRVRLYTDKTSGMGAFQGFVEFWSAAPTFTNGDNGAYAVATGADKWLGSSTLAVMTQVADGGYAAGVPTTGNEIGFVVGGGDLYWSLKEADGSGFTPASGQTFTLVAEIHSPN